MIRRPYTKRAMRLVAAIVVGLTVVGSLGAVATAAGSTPPLGREDFIPMGAEGHGDRNNGWTWSMAWYKNNLYVGSNRAYGCVTQASLAALNPTVQYPPGDPDMQCSNNPSDLPLQAEIWKWSPETNSWTRQYQSPNNIPNPNPPDAGKFLPPDIGFRSSVEYLDPDGKSWMVFGGVSANVLGLGTIAPPEMLYTDDGSTWTPIPHDPGTFLGNLTLTSFRSLTQFGNQIFVINGSIQGAGPIIASSTPLLGNDTWTQVTPPTVSYYQMLEFNGWLYAGVVDIANGYSVVKTQAAGPPPYTWIPVVTYGGYRTPSPSQYPISMKIFNGRLYVGTVNPPEEIRVNADDTWDLVVGDPRQMPDGTWKYPLSGLGEGFNNDFNGHIWRMGLHNGQLFLGTYDNSIRYKNDPNAIHIFKTMGFDLFRTVDGWRMTNLSTTGFTNEFDYGVRNFQDTPYGMFFGTANEYYGLTIYRGLDGPTTRVAAPSRLDLEMSHNQPVLTWDPVLGATSYHVLRAPFATVTLSPSAIQPGGTFRFPDKFVEITPVGGISDTVFVDGPILSTNPTYEYYVTALDGGGESSDPSNLALAPNILPPTTFTSLIEYASLQQIRGLFLSPALASSSIQTIQTAQAAAGNGQVDVALDALQGLDTEVLNGSVMLNPDLDDFDILLAKLERRLKLANNLLVDLESLQ
jgi:hypothetical protein